MKVLSPSLYFLITSQNSSTKLNLSKNNLNLMKLFRKIKSIEHTSRITCLGLWNQNICSGCSNSTICIWDAEGNYIQLWKATVNLLRVFVNGIIFSVVDPMTGQFEFGTQKENV